VEKGGVDVAKSTKVGFEMENEGTKVATHKKSMVLRKVEKQQIWFMMGPLWGMTMG